LRTYRESGKIILVKSEDNEESILDECYAIGKCAVCKYFTYKIFHWLKMFHDIELEVFTAEFVMERSGLWELYDATIYKLNYSADLYATEEVAKLGFLNGDNGKVVQTTKDIVVEHRKAIQPIVEGITRRRQNRVVDQKLTEEDALLDYLGKDLPLNEYEMDEINNAVGRANIKKVKGTGEDMPIQHITTMAELRKELRHDKVQLKVFSLMQNRLEPNFTKMHQEIKRNNIMRKKLDECEETFRELHPKVHVRLQDIIMPEHMDSDWAMKNALKPKEVVKCLNPELNLKKRDENLAEMARQLSFKPIEHTNIPRVIFDFKPKTSKEKDEIRRTEYQKRKKIFNMIKDSRSKNLCEAMKYQLLFDKAAEEASNLDREKTIKKFCSNYSVDRSTQQGYKVVAKDYLVGLKHFSVGSNSSRDLDDRIARGRFRTQRVIDKILDEEIQLSERRSSRSECPSSYSQYYHHPQSVASIDMLYQKRKPLVRLKSKGQLESLNTRMKNAERQNRLRTYKISSISSKNSFSDETTFRNNKNNDES